MATEIICKSRDFHHPYEPYSIQETFMETVYQTLENKVVGILESPTGTGKSLSLICGALTWLRDQKKKALEEALTWDANDTDEPEWVIEQAKERRRRALLSQREELETRLAQIRLKEKAEHERYLRGENLSKKRKINHFKLVTNDEEQFVLDDYESDRDKNRSRKGSGYLFSPETVALLNKIGMGPESCKNQEDEMEDELKIFYISRTHSQLTQFINELRLPKFPSFVEKEIGHVCDIEDLKHVTLGSRKSLCINPAVQQLGSLASINERCMELQHSTTSKPQKCLFLPNEENRPLVNTFRDHSLANIRDIEDMYTLGKKLAICPYYASRSAIKSAEIVTLPYPLLLQKSAREALGINLKGHVVIIDEAHNLMDAISNINGVKISLRQIKQARAQLGTYLHKFRNRLKGKNRVYIAQILRVIDSLTAYLEAQLIGMKTEGTVSEKDLLSGKGADQVNFFKIIHYLQESKLAYKVEGYVIFAEETARSSQHKASDSPVPNVNSESSTPVIHQLSSLFIALTQPPKVGRFLFSKSSPDQITLQYLHLNPATQFQEIVSSARAIILAGGTMSPMSDYTLHLFPYLKKDSITTLSCGHVIPQGNLLVWNLSKGQLGQDFEFTFARRGDENMLDDLGHSILNICEVVPDGVVVFFPSYKYLSSAMIRWSIGPSNGCESILQRLEARKRVFQERKDVVVDKILQDYAKAIDSHQGGILFSVVGGKMSEGINFSDALGRCVVIIGLPYPNIKSVEWKAKIEYVEEAFIERFRNEKLTDFGENNSTDSEARMRRKANEISRDFYENSCMRAVNQSIGRAIRHRRDYAAIIMVDKRYSNERIKQKLPGWIKESLHTDFVEKSFGAMITQLGTFFKSKKDI